MCTRLAVKTRLPGVAKNSFKYFVKARRGNVCKNVISPLQKSILSYHISKIIADDLQR